MGRCFAEQSLNGDIPQSQAVNISLDSEQSTETLENTSSEMRLKDCCQSSLFSGNRLCF